MSSNKADTFLVSRPLFLTFHLTAILVFHRLPSYVFACSSRLAPYEHLTDQNDQPITMENHFRCVCIGRCGLVLDTYVQSLEHMFRKATLRNKVALEVVPRYSPC